MLCCCCSFTARNKSLYTEYSYTSGVWTVTPVVYLAPPQGPNSSWVYTAGVTAKQSLPQRPMGLTTLTAGYDIGSESASIAVEGRPGWKVHTHPPPPPAPLLPNTAMLMPTPSLFRRKGARRLSATDLFTPIDNVMIDTPPSLEPVSHSLASLSVPHSLRRAQCPGRQSVRNVWIYKQDDLHEVHVSIGHSTCRSPGQCSSTAAIADKGPFP